MESYPGYRLEDVYRKSFKDGGLTILQIHTMFGHSQKRKVEEWKFMSRIHGIDPDGKQSSQSATKPEAQDNLPLFGDPSSYEHMSPEERQELTERMMGQHKSWRGEKPEAVGG